VTAPPAEGAPAPVRAENRRPRPTALTVFLGVLVVVFAVYTQLAMGMEWRTQAGRIGPGFFPRITGLLGMVLCCVAALRSLRPAGPAESAESAEPTRSPEAVEGVRADEPAVGEGRRAEPEGEPAGETRTGRHPWLLAATAAGLAVMVITLLPLGAVLTSALFIFGMSRLLGRSRLVFDLALSLLVPIALYLLFEVGLNAGLPRGVLPMF
jgi:putative tricarboxylic transport membrane protein